MRPAVQLIRRPTPPAASSMPSPSPCPSSGAPPLRPPELPLPSALVPPKKRRVLRTPPKATAPIPPPPPFPAAADSLAFPTPAPPAHVDAPDSPLSSDQKPYSPPPPAAADEKPSALHPCGAAAELAPARKVRNFTRKVVLDGAIAERKVAAWAASAAAGALQPREGDATDKSPADGNAAADEVVGKEQSLGESRTDKLTTCCDSISVCEALSVGIGAVAGEPVTDCGDATEVDKLGSKDEKWVEVGMSERQRRRMTEVFVGGLNRDAKEEDVKEVLAAAGEIAEVRMIMDTRTKKNKGYCFVRYHEAAQARRAIAEFSNVKICGKLCRVAALGGNDKIFLGNIDKKWNREDIMKLLQKIEIKNIDVVTLMADPNNPGCNHGFAFLELETYRDAQVAYRKLSRKNAFGKGLNITVEWALNDPDEKQMQKVKTVFVEGVPDAWDQAKMAEIFRKYGKIELVVLSRDLQSAKRSDFAFIHYSTREAAISCIESFEREQLTENGSKVNIKVSLAKSVQKGKKNIEDHKFCIIERDKTKTPKTGTLVQDYPHICSGKKRPFSVLGNDTYYYMSHNPHARHAINTHAISTSSYGVSPHAITGYFPYHHDSRCLADSDSVVAEPFGGIQVRHAGYRKPG